MRVELRRTLSMDLGDVEVVNALDWLPDMPVPGPHDVLMDANGNWSTVLRRFFYEDPPLVALKLTHITVPSVALWLEAHPGWHEVPAS
jgi:hypothetical protein